MNPHTKAHRGWPTRDLAEKHPHYIQPIVSGAKFIVRCPCGYAADSAQPTKGLAIAEISARHSCEFTQTARTHGGPEKSAKLSRLKQEYDTPETDWTATAYTP